VGGRDGEHDPAEPPLHRAPGAHPALVGESGFIAAQDVSARRGPTPRSEPGAPGKRRYLLAGLLVCGECGRRMESSATSRCAGSHR
jgi:hypothetical protein